MNVMDAINPKRIFNKFVELFGPRKTVVALGVGASLAIAGMTTVFVAYPDDPKTVTENIVEKEND